MLKRPTLKRKKMMMEVDQDGEEEKMEVEESETKRSRANEEESNYSLETVKHGFQFVSLSPSSKLNAQFGLSRSRFRLAF